MAERRENSQWLPGGLAEVRSSRAASANAPAESAATTRASAAGPGLTGYLIDAGVHYPYQLVAMDGRRGWVSAGSKRRVAADAEGVDFVLNARTDAFVKGRDRDPGGRRRDRIVIHVMRPAFLDRAAAVEDHDAVAKLQYLVETVRGVKRGKLFVRNRFTHLPGDERSVAAPSVPHSVPAAAKPKPLESTFAK